MTREEFWRLVEEPELTCLNASEYTRELTHRLEQLGPAEIVSFENHVNQLTQQVNTWELYDILGIIEDYFARDDGFWEFTQGLVALGRECFEAVRNNPEWVGEFTESHWAAIERAPLGAARTAFENVTGNPAYHGYDNEVEEQVESYTRQGKHLKDEELARKYPDLWHRFAFEESDSEMDARWLTWGNGTVRKLAESVDASRRFEDLPMLADALEEAGCSDRAILDHCRAGIVHRGSCWVVNALLGKEEPDTMPAG